MRHGGGLALAEGELWCLWTLTALGVSPLRSQHPPLGLIPTAGRELALAKAGAGFASIYI